MRSRPRPPSLSGLGRGQVGPAGRPARPAAPHLTARSKRQALRYPLLLDPDAGVDRQDLNRLIHRFVRQSALRLQRAALGLGRHQRNVIDLLPLLLHQNHPLLPGYVDHAVPSGLSCWSPPPELLRLAGHLQRGYRYQARGQRRRIRALFLMGSTGSIAQVPGSDLDLWVCHDEDFEAGEVSALAEKCARIEAWAATQGVELHLFLVNPAEYRLRQRNARLGAEDCGSSQHLLLMDEFYRSHIWLAGAWPLWWLIPPGREQDYAELAALYFGKRFIRREDFVDLGSCPEIPAAEFVGAGLWQLYKSLDAPFKSALKLMLVEAYALDRGRVPILSQRCKAHIYADQLEHPMLDPYLGAYLYLEESLLRNQREERLAFARKCLYLKSGVSRSRPASERQCWKDEMLEPLMRTWDWQAEDFHRLDRRLYWNWQDAHAESQMVTSELTASYRFLSAMAREEQLQSAIRAEDIHLLGRKLYAIFQRRAGKLEILNPGIAPDISESSLVFRGQPPGQTQQEWGLFASRNADNGTLHQVRVSPSLFELLAWSHLNGLLTSATSVSLIPGQSQATLAELQQLRELLGRFLPVPRPTPGQEDFRGPGHLRKVLLAINVGLDPKEALSRRGFSLVSEFNDPLAYGEERVNLVQRVDLLTCNAWNEVTCQHFAEGDPLIQALQVWMTLLEESVGGTVAPPLPELQVCCFCPTRAALIARRVQELLEQILENFFQAQAYAVRVLWHWGRGYVLLYRQDHRLRFAQVDDRAQLLSLLGLPAAVHSRVLMDRQTLQGDPLRQVLLSQHRGRIEVFREDLDDQTRVYVCDERGSLHLEHYPGPVADREARCHGLHRFLENVADRRSMQGGAVAELDLSAPLVWYRTSTGGEPQPMHKPGTDSKITGWVDQVPLRILASVRGYVLILAQQEFALEQDPFKADLVPVARALRTCFRPGVSVQFSIEDVSLSGGFHDEQQHSTRQTLHYLQLRQRFEQALRAALSE